MEYIMNLPMRYILNVEMYHGILEEELLSRNKVEV